ncbi:unnamed protein product [Ilex paraguariensis]|uniref:Putative zinc-finger domain-containing protein n=1 Tax=Ilex paraguariensis TaxID=185542 RepID=A0ABC8U878_9AQUA
MKVADSSHFVQSQTGREEIHSSDINGKKGNSVGCNEYEPRILNSNSIKETSININVGEVGSYTCNLDIDPFWPLCMYELRGKCNNDDCCWQHVRDYSNRNMNYDKSDNSDCHVGSLLHKVEFGGATNLSKCLDFLVLAPPTYLVCLDTLKADLHSYKSVLVEGVGRCWKKCFSASFVLSSLLPTDLPSDEPFLHGTETRVEVHGVWNRRSLYYQCRNGAVSQLDQHLADGELSLEMALLNLNQEINKQKGRIEALKVLAGALEADPTSVVLWVAYLQIFYSNQTSVGKDDMFHCAPAHLHCFHATNKSIGKDDMFHHAWTLITPETPGCVMVSVWLTLIIDLVMTIEALFSACFLGPANLYRLCSLVERVRCAKLGFPALLSDDGVMYGYIYEDLWCPYTCLRPPAHLHCFHATNKSIGKDDMFHHAWTLITPETPGCVMVSVWLTLIIDLVMTIEVSEWLFYFGICYVWLQSNKCIEEWTRSVRCAKLGFPALLSDDGVMYGYIYEDLWWPYTCLRPVVHNDGSYELWLMYINSRVQIDNRLIAYDTALSALSRHSSASDGDAMHASECVLDLFLQMMNCLCISGMVGQAFEKIHGLFPSSKKSDEPYSLFLSDILASLTIRDKCIFWICCVYLVVYEKLPDAVVQQFECQKELSAIEWPLTDLTDDRKQLAVRLMERAVDFLALYIDCDSLENEPTLGAAKWFAVNHIRCIAVLKGLECSRNLLDKYNKLYPSCLELVLMLARTREHGLLDPSFIGFEEALGNWLEGVPGVQCIWNQYAECALRNGRFDFVQKLMDRWHHSVWEVQCAQCGVSDTMDAQNSNSSPKTFPAGDPDAWISVSSKVDVVFGLLNLSLHKLLHNDPFEARLAMDRALEEAASEDYRHCVREHAVFLVRDGSQFKKDDPISKIITILNGYVVDERAFRASKPLSRKYIQSIKKPRVQQLVGSLLSPLSTDFSLVNLVLEVWYGQSLLPETLSRVTDLVDFIEAVMEILPSNYQLAISVCKLLSRGSNSGDVAASVSFWASSLLVHALFQAVPVAPEFVWVEAAYVLHNLTHIHSISESFHRRALDVYPFSIKLWKSYLNVSRTTENVSSVIEGARKRGITLD